ncbi:DUF58 domain-containing protein [Frankia sp. EAN1pec]|uniref:DUF58 domain-containing protein n=1 Tax=Parafrankia sp. (strain EAN1pec) TaxID=298653 RepID=UPI000674B5C0
MIVTSVGRQAAGGVVILAGVAGLLRSVEISVLAIGGLLLFLAAAHAVRGRPTAELSLTPTPPTATRGEWVTITVSAQSPRDSRSQGADVELVRLGPAATRVRLPALAPGASWTCDVRIHALQRGVHRLSPATLRRGDRFGLLLRSEPTGGGEAVVRVYPEILDLQTPTSDLGMIENGVARLLDHGTEFHGLRAYVQGDDLRQVHAASSARTGRLLVRENADDSVSSTSWVLFDDRRSSYPADADGDQAYEDGLTCAVSIAASAVRAGSGGALGTLSGRTVTHYGDPADHCRILDMASEADPVVTGDPAAGSRVARFLATVRESATVWTAGTAVVVTGTESPDALDVAAGLTGLCAPVIVVRVGRGPTSVRMTPEPGLLILSVGDTEEVVRAWPRLLGALTGQARWVG